MRDYKTVAQRVLQRRDAYVLAQKRKRRMMIKYAAVPACLFLVIGAGTRIWQQTDAGRHILEQNAVEMTENPAVTEANIWSTESTGNLWGTENTEHTEYTDSMNSVSSEDVTENQDRPDDLPPMPTGMDADAESEPYDNAASEIEQTEHGITQVVPLEVPVMQETKPEQNATVPTETKSETKPEQNVSSATESIPGQIPFMTETIPDLTSPPNDATATETSASDDPPVLEPTEFDETDPAPAATETAPAPSETDPEAPEPTAPGDWVETTRDSPSNSLVPSTTNMTTETIMATFPTTETSPTKKPTDYTITVEEFIPTREQLSNVTHETISLEFPENYDSFEQLFEHASAAVRCQVLSVMYTIMQDTPYTVYHVEILESFSGSFITGDKLSVVQYGGYLVPENSCDSNPDDDPKPPSSQTQTELIEQQIACSEKPVISQEYVLFLNPDNVFDGAYETLNENEGMFRYDPETGELIRSVEQDATVSSSSYGDLLAAGDRFINGY